MTEVLYARTRVGYAVVFCRACNFAARTAIPSRDLMERHYNRNGYLDFLIKGGKTASGKQIREDAENQLRQAQTIIDQMEISKRIPAGAPKTLFDVGFGTGEFLEIFRRWGFELSGCDYSRPCVAYVREKFRSANLFYGRFEDLDIPPNRYSVVVMASVIEHFENPVAALKKAYAILTPGGILIMTGANFGSWAQRNDGPAWIGFTKGHFYFFSPAALRKILFKTGFRNVKFYHPDNRRFFRREDLMRRLWRRAYLLFARGPLIRRSKKFFLIAVKCR